MIKAYQRLMIVLACATDKQLAKQVQYLKAENEILRARLPKRITPTAVEGRQLLKLGRPLGAPTKALYRERTPRAKEAAGKSARDQAAFPKRVVSEASLAMVGTVAMSGCASFC
jgi:hypothetical protein